MAQVTPVIRCFCLCLCLLLSLSLASEIHRILFASCNNAERKGIWSALSNQDPDRFLFLGDSVYVDDSRYSKLAAVDKLRASYNQLANDDGWIKFVKKLGWDNILATYGASKSISLQHILKLIFCFDYPIYCFLTL